MKLRLPLLCRCLLLTLLAVAGLALPGCKTNDEPANESSIPWNRPKSWEYGMPGMGGMMDRR